jgi:hypothetical protein
MYWRRRAVMTTFRRIKIQAKVEMEPLLLTDEQIAGALQALRDRLAGLDVAVVSLEAKEADPVEVPASLEYRD